MKKNTKKARKWGQNPLKLQDCAEEQREMTQKQKSHMLAPAGFERELIVHNHYI